MIKKRSPKKIIESSKNSKVEQVYMRLGGRELQDISTSSGKEVVYFDMETIEKTLNQSGSDKYTMFHTHPVMERFGFLNLPEPNVRKRVYPSMQDIYSFMKDAKRKKEIIAARGVKTGKVYGYLIIQKTKDTPVVGDINDTEDETIRPLRKYPLWMNPKDSIADYQESLETIAKQYHLKFKMIGRAGERNKYLAGPSVIGLLTSLFFLSASITGNVIGNITNPTSSVIGATLLIASLIIGYFQIRKN